MPKNRPPNQTPSTNRNRYEQFADDETSQKPSYSKIASSNRVTDLPLSETKPETQPDTLKDSIDSKFDTLLSAMKDIKVRMNDSETKNQNEFWALNSRFSDMENKLEQDDAPAKNNENQSMSDNDPDMANEAHGNISNQPRRGCDRTCFCPPQSADTQASFLNQNQFSLAITNSKIKYVEMERYLATRELEDDSTEAIKSMYESIIRSIMYVFSTQLDVMPSFYDLDRDVKFKSYFLQGLFSDTLDRCKTVYDHIGQVILDYLKNKSNISDSRSPEAYTIITANKFLGGWNLLEKLLKGRVPTCGADLDIDLDAKRIALILNDNESVRDFYIRTQQLQNEYTIQATDPTFVPVVKIVRTFLKQLARCTLYQPTLATFQNDLTDHISEYGIDNNMNPLSFTITTIYDRLVKAQVPMIPPTLSANETQAMRTSTSQLAPTNNFSTMIASMETPFCLDCNDPTICARISGKTRCQACLLGFHDENDCFMRGESFQPPGLTRRLKIYNKVNGDAPPPNHKMREWDPPLVPPIHDKNSKNVSDWGNKNDKLNNPQHRKKPFQNTRTKSNTRTINAFDAQLENDIDSDSIDVDHTMSAFVQEQLQFEENTLNQEEVKIDEVDSTICVFSMNYIEIEPTICSAHQYPPNQPPIQSDQSTSHLHTEIEQPDTEITEASRIDHEEIESNSVNASQTNTIDNPIDMNQQDRVALMQRRLQLNFRRQNPNINPPSPATSTTTEISSLSFHGSITSNEIEQRTDHSDNIEPTQNSMKDDTLSLSISKKQYCTKSIINQP